MKRAKILIYTFLLSGGSLFAYTVDEIVRMAWQNGRVAGLEAASEAEITDMSAENSLSGPEVEVEHQWAASDHKKLNIGVTQSFDWPGVYSARSKQVEQFRKITDLRQEVLKKELKNEALSLLLRISYAQEKINRVDEQFRIIEKIKDELDRALDKGLVTILDQKKAHIESSTLKIQLEQLTAERNSLISELVVLTNHDFDENNTDWISLRKPLALLNLDHYLAGLESSPEMLLAAENQKNAELGTQSAKASLLPGFSVGYRHETEQDVHFNGFSIGVNLPSWNFSKKKKAAGAKVMQAETEYMTLHQTLSERIKSEYRQVVALRESISGIESYTSDDTYLKLLNRALEVGEISMINYLQELNYYNSTLAQTIDLQTQYQLLLLSLSRYSQPD